MDELLSVLGRVNKSLKRIRKTLHDNPEDVPMYAADSIEDEVLLIEGLVKEALYIYKERNNSDG